MDDTQLRDQLAVERTALANERTLLAYLRTALAFVAAGAAILHFYLDHPALVASAIALVIIGFTTAGIGSIRFARVQRRLRLPQG
ncbi:DUF202 domain-containing protein [Spongiibacter taiwanensis]|uniref:DUF202 domain-containing protein n=1 Tax=Spongiibacter taiwanensis TaxID=1748242 RepID=UPI00203512F2|nr:DUF202 domain-containing protein [Spongiibacter taiwanensis]USA42232.1 DUF202 domain-containing protein [Spongiibacter taiwanensis]